MKHLFAFIALLGLAGTLQSLQAGSAPQAAPAAPAGKTAEQQKTDQSQCIQWAKQQAGLSQPDAQQPAATSGSEKTGAAANQGGAAANPAAPANQGAAPASPGAAAKPTDNAVQSATSSAINQAESKLGLGGVANSKITELAKEAYAQCMQKKGYTTK